ncbi:LIC_10190 family membrane protein [Flavobacterium sp.]|uniref:LIC_10190 family membrane protein n=1 Tax=Flavobacterium sp. TaxID=239 RepID=UPI00391AE602
MTLILLSWLYVFFTSIVVGIGFSKLFRIQSLTVVITSILGLFGITLLASSWAIFGPINVGFHFFLLILSLGFGFGFKTELKEIIKSTLLQFNTFSLSIKILFGISSLLILAQSATLPFIVDNETYYIQTIKWLNEYGFVPGLANLHLFLGQTSGWHITQSVYSFSFLYDSLNDLNGYLFLMGNFWAFQKLHSYFSDGNRMDLVFGLLPLAYVFLFQFISAPSPDLVVYFIGFIIFSLYLELQLDFKLEKFSIITALVLFVIYNKITAVVLLLLPLIFFVKYAALLKNQLIRLQLLSGLVLFLFSVKNILLTGYPFYPLTIFPYSTADYLVPNKIMDYFFSPKMMHSFYMPFGDFEDASFIEFLKNYFLQSGIDGIFGLTTILLVIVSPFLFIKYYPKQSVRDIYVVFVILLALLTFSSPQYRFYLYFTIFFGLIFLSILFTNKKLILGLISLSLIVITALVFVPMSFSALTQNKLLSNNNTFQTKNFILPEPNTKEKLHYINLRKGNLDYYSPTETPIFWITGKSDLPCVSKEQMDYFETYFHVIPQLRGETLSEGFYAKKVKADD